MGSPRRGISSSAARSVLRKSNDDRNHHFTARHHRTLPLVRAFVHVASPHRSGIFEALADIRSVWRQGPGAAHGQEVARASVQRDAPRGSAPSRSRGTRTSSALSVPVWSLQRRLCRRAPIRPPPPPPPPHDTPGTVDDRASAVRPPEMLSAAFVNDPPPRRAHPRSQPGGFSGELGSMERQSDFYKKVGGAATKDNTSSKRRREVGSATSVYSPRPEARLGEPTSYPIADSTKVGATETRASSGTCKSLRDSASHSTPSLGTVVLPTLFGTALKLATC